MNTQPRSCRLCGYAGGTCNCEQWIAQSRLQLTPAMITAFINMWAPGFCNEDMARGCWNAMIMAHEAEELPKPYRGTDSLSDIRGHFEAAYPVPFNVSWDVAAQRYRWNRANNSLTAADEQNIRWQVWQTCAAKLNDRR